MKILKIFLIIIAVIGGLIILFLALLGLGIFGMISTIASAANVEVDQRVDLVNGNIKIYAPLVENKGLVFDNINICNEELPDHSYVSSLISSRVYVFKKYTLTLRDDVSENQIPETIGIYTQDSAGNCNLTKFTTTDKIKTVDYSVKIEFTDKLVELLDLKGASDYNVSSPNAQGSSVYQFLGTKKASFTYTTKKEHYDLLINKVKKADIVVVGDEK